MFKKYRKYAAFLLVLLVGLLGLSGCGEGVALTVTLETPANGSTVSSLTPILAWNCNYSDATYRLQVSQHGNFQDLIIDESNLAGPSYTVASGKLAEGQTYYWKVNASKGGRTSAWTEAWAFQTPGASPTPPEPGVGTIVVNATLDGASWAGKVNYTITGPQGYSGSSVAQTFSNIAAGSYTVGYNAGGPSGATLSSITPQPTQTTSADSTTTFTMNFVSQAASTIKIKATLDGESWSGAVRYNISGPYSDADTSVPQTLTNLPDGTYTISYRSGGPSGAPLSEISPSPTQTVSSGHTITFTLNFHSEASGTIKVKARLDGSTWKTAVGSGTISYGISGPVTDSSTSIPDTFDGLPAGSYTLNYYDGGPIGATLGSISPQPTQTLSSGGTITYTLNFQSEARGTVIVNATVNGEDWAGSVSYTLNGPYVDSHGSVPYTFDNCPAGSYTLNYRSGGPGILDDITPSPSQQLYAGGTIVFTLNFTGLLQ